MRALSIFITLLVLTAVVNVQAAKLIKCVSKDGLTEIKDEVQMGDLEVAEDIDKSNKFKITGLTGGEPKVRSCHVALGSTF